MPLIRSGILIGTLYGSGKKKTVSEKCLMQSLLSHVSFIIHIPFILIDDSLEGELALLLY